MKIIKHSENSIVVDSREVAEMIGKDHKHLMRDIRGYINVLDESPTLDYQEFFIESSYLTVQNKMQPCFNITKKGCDMVANKMIGTKGILFTAEYVSAFDDYEKQIKGSNKQLSPMEQLKLQYEVLDNHEERVLKIEKALESMEITPLQRKNIQRAKSSKIIELLGGKKSNAYKDASFRSRVYAAINREYQDYFEVNSYEYTPKARFNEALEFIREFSLSAQLKMDLKLFV
ncbi:MAG: Rha family transcriptional regulator [Sarcina sp.]